MLGFSADRRVRVVRSVTPDGTTDDAPLAPAGARVVAASCDEAALTVVVTRPGSREAALFSCAYLGACTPMPPPRVGKDGPLLRWPFDVARVSGFTIVAARMGDLVRVASTRDEGKSWTPFVVAFDAQAHPEARADVAFPERLSVVGRRVLLHGAPARATVTYPVLASDDSGASFHAP